MGETVNLRRARKQRKRERDAAAAAQNRAVFGRSKAERNLNESERALIETRLEGSRLASAPSDAD